MRSNTRGGLMLVAVFALVATAAACGSTSAKSASTTTAAASATTAAAGTQASVPPDTKPKKVKATGGGSFCKKLAAAINKENSQSDADITPAGMKAQFSSGIKLIDDAVSSAPGSIKPDLKVLQAALKGEAAALTKVNYDATKLTPADLDAFSTPAVTAASDKVDAYVKNTCGIDTGDDESSTSTP